MKKINLLLFAIILTSSIQAQLPPVFGEEYNDKVQHSDLVKTYITPQKIVWQSDNSDEFIKNAISLLNKGNGQLAVNDKDLCHFISSEENKPGILLDYGKEIHGGVKISMGIRESKTPLKLRLRFGESVGEAMSDIGGRQNATNEHSLRDFIIEVPWLGSVEVGETGFRFLRIDVVEAGEDAPIKSIDASFIYRDIPYLGSFKSNDERLNKIWATGAYTVHLNMQNYLWDGIKRDRLVWVGDLHPEVMTVNAVFGYNEVVPKSLDLIRDITSPDQWMNGISSYSMWWILIHKEWYLNHGDLKYLEEQKDYLAQLLKKFAGMVDEEGKEHLDGNRFLDWPSSTNTKAIDAGYHALLKMTFEAGEELSTVLGDLETAKLCSKKIAVMESIVPDVANSKQAAALLTISSTIAAEKGNEVITKDGAQRFSTFYGYYMLEAMAKAGNYAEAIEIISTYWGGMLDLGATTFWEDFDINWMKDAGRIDEMPAVNKVDVHSAYGGYCYVGYRHSFCHGWASGPTAWLSQHVLGIKILAPGCAEVSIEPHLGDLQWVEGTYPTPMGLIKVRHEKLENGEIKSEISVPEGVKIIK